MAASFGVIFVLFQWLFLVQLSSALPMCTDLRAPTKAESPLEFCAEYNGGSTCCDSKKDAQLKKQFSALNISDSSCASLLKSILCAQCDPFSADLFRAKTGHQKQQQRSLPLLCNSTTTGSSSKSTTTSFCSTVWNTCKSITIPNSPFAPSLQGGSSGPTTPTSSSTLFDLWQSEHTFCDIFGATSSSDSTTTCFEGGPVKLKNTTLSTPDSNNDVAGLCLERLGNDGYINMAPHPDGSARAFFSNLKGQVWLADLPEQDSGSKLGLDESDPFVDLTDHMLFDTMFGMLGIAFHPEFAKNGRFFASYNCDRLNSPACAGRCACNSDVDCDPSTLNSTGQHATPCQYQSVVAEFSANGTASSPGQAKTAKPVEVRRIFTMGLPFTSDHGGQILFGPEDGYLYLMMGDGGGKNDPYNFAQNKKSVLGKVLRLDVDNIPSQKEINELGLWGSYSIPRDNPYSEDKELAQEVWAMGFRNPWRCSFDAERPSYFVCADVGQDLYEEVDLVTKGGNYGWGTYEGPILTTPTKLSATNESTVKQSLIFPVAGYTHEQINNKIGSAAISGGFFYRADTDPCMSGRYLYGDLYASNIWAATETPTNSGNFTTKDIPFSCAHDSPVACGIVPGSKRPALEYIYSFGQDNSKDIYILASSGVYRVVRPSRCNYACSKEVKRPDQVGPGAPGPSLSPSGGARMVERPPHGKWLVWLAVVSFLLLDRLVS